MTDMQSGPEVPAVGLDPMAGPVPSVLPPEVVYGPGGACARTLESLRDDELINGACPGCRHAKMAHHAFGCGWVGCKGGGE